MSLEDFRKDIDRCSSCSYCKSIPFDKIKSLRYSDCCPSVAYYNFNAYSARGRLSVSKSLLDGISSYNAATLDIINSCLTCGACDVSCKVCRYDLEPLEHNLELKKRAVEEGNVLPQILPAVASLKNENTMIPGMIKADRSNWAKGLNIKDLTREKAEVVFFPGCKYSYDKKLQETAKSAVKLLVDAGVDLGYMGSADNCCAGRAYQMGLHEVFNNRAELNIKAFKMLGVKLIVTTCSDCYYSFKRLYAKLGIDIEVLHTVEYIDRLIQEGKIKFTKSLPWTITYHDPCHLGRQGEQYVTWNGKEKKIFNQINVWEPRKPRYNGAYGIYDSPRNILKSIPGIKLVEMERIREYSWCCGAGGGCSEALPAYSAWTAGERISEANSTGAEALVTACPWCESNLKNAADENGRTIKVLDIIDVVRQAI